MEVDLPIPHECDLGIINLILCIPRKVRGNNGINREKNFMCSPIARDLWSRIQS